MQDIHRQLQDLRRKVMGQQYVTPAENTLADDLAALIEIVGCVVSRLDRIDRSSKSAANAASCLANGIMPD